MTWPGAVVLLGFFWLLSSALKNLSDSPPTHSPLVEPSHPIWQSFTSSEKFRPEDILPRDQARLDDLEMRVHPAPGALIYEPKGCRWVWCAAGTSAEGDGFVNYSFRVNNYVDTVSPREAIDQWMEDEEEL